MYIFNHLKIMRPIMKLFFLLAFSIILLWSCNRPEKNIDHNPNELIYKSGDIATRVLPVTLTLSGDMATGALSARLKLENHGSKPVDIQEIVIATSEGIRSAPDSGNVSFSIQPGTDSTLSLRFHPINDGNLYRIAGMRGNLKPFYNLSITYKAEGDAGLITSVVGSQADKVEYLAYSRKYKSPIIGYLFNTKAGFNEREKKYLEILQPAGQQPFVYLSEQEIAVSGLNFRLHGYILKDTLHAELYILNHSEFPMKIIPGAFDITDDANAATGTKFMKLEKISGSQQDLSMMEKGDRVVIHFKKPMNIKSPGKGNLSLHLQKVFMLTGRKNLFNEDVQLLPVTL
jgi:hypothetical protein